MSATLTTPWMVDRNGTLRSFAGTPIPLDDEATGKLIANTMNGHAAMVEAVKSRASEIRLDAELARMMRAFL